jgi:hypothetical protein
MLRLDDITEQQVMGKVFTAVMAITPPDKVQAK